MHLAALKVTQSQLALVAAGANKKAVYADKNTTMYLAARRGHIDTAEVLIATEPNYDAVDFE